MLEEQNIATRPTADFAQDFLRGYRLAPALQFQGMSLAPRVIPWPLLGAFRCRGVSVEARSD
jgi:hypothetical protein